MSHCLFDKASHGSCYKHLLCILSECRRVFLSFTEKKMSLCFQPLTKSLLFTSSDVDKPTVKPDEHCRRMFGIVSHSLCLQWEVRRRRILGRRQHGWVPAATDTADRTLVYRHLLTLCLVMMSWPGSDSGSVLKSHQIPLRLFFPLISNVLAFEMSRAAPSADVSFAG